MAKKLNREQERILREMLKAEKPVRPPPAGLFWSDVPASGEVEPVAQPELSLLFDDDYEWPGRS